VSHRAPGDRIQPLGFPYEKKLQDVLVDAHVPRLLRDSLPIVRDATGIVWIPGVTVAETKRVTATSTEQWHLEIVTT
jgi:tRNA(Ile)-lysidine synthase